MYIYSKKVGQVGQRVKSTSMVGQLGRTGRTGVMTGFIKGKNETFFDKW